MTKVPGDIDSGTSGCGRHRADACTALLELHRQYMHDAGMRRSGRAFYDAASFFVMYEQGVIGQA